MAQEYKSNVKKKGKLDRCKSCNRSSYFVSENGNCSECVKAKVLNSKIQQQLRKGPIYDKWKRSFGNFVKNLP